MQKVRRTDAAALRVYQMRHVQQTFRHGNKGKKEELTRRGDGCCIFVTPFFYVKNCVVYGFRALKGFAYGG